MSEERPDPFTEAPVHQQSVQPPGNSQAPPDNPPALQSGGGQYGIPQYNAQPYGGASMQGSHFPAVGGAYGGYSAMPGYAGAYGNVYNNGYSSGYPGYGMPYANGYPSIQRQSAATQLASGARETGAMVLSGMQEAMSRFARVSALIEEVLRHLHMLFDALFGLGFSIGAFRQEASLWLAIKTGPVGYLARLVRRASNVWRLLCLFFMSPMAGRFSPVALVLRILGLVPEEDPLDASLTELWRNQEQPEQDADDSSSRGLDSSNM